MLSGKTSTKERISRASSNRGGRWRRFRNNLPARWSLRVLIALVFIAVFADFLANEKPLYCRLEGRHYFPVLRQYAVDLGWSQWEARFVQADWRELPYQRVIYAPVPYSATTIDRKSMNYRSPFERRPDTPWRLHHWLGTDQLGRDVLAGMIRGTRIALSVGLVAMSVALLIGVFLGAVAGYFGDRGWQVSRIGLFLSIIGLALGVFYAVVPRRYAFQEGVPAWELLKSAGIAFVFLGAGWLLSRPLRRVPWLGRPVRVPVDMLVMRLIEIVNSIPGLLLLLALAGIVRQPSILFIMLIIGLIGWTGIARFTRAELLRIRQESYIEAARALGFRHRRILFYHALPNALTPVLIALAFGIANAVLLEALLSFLGIGLPTDSVTWGTLLNLARSAPKAWWLALFPGLAIFVTVTAFNLIGEGLTEGRG